MPNSQNDIGNEAPAYGGGGLLDNCISRAKIVAGNSNFLTTAALNVTLAASAGTPFEVSVGGKRVLLTSNVVFGLTDNAHNFIYIDQTGALSRVATPPTYAFTAPGGPASGDMWFDLSMNQMNTWNGAAWVASNKVMIGYQRCDSGGPTGDAVSMPIGAYPLWIWENFGNGSDGFLDVSAGTTTIDNAKNYTAVIVRGAGTLQHSANGVGNQLSIRCQTIYAQIGTSGLDLKGLGRQAAAGGTGAGAAGNLGGTGGSGGGGGGGTSAGGAGGTRVRSGTFQASSGGTGGSAGGGAAGAGTATDYPSGNGRPFGFCSLSAAGGSGGGSGAANGGTGGSGGGTAFLSAPVIDITAASIIRVDGANGTAGAAAACGGGGGGGGGILELVYRNLFQNQAPTALAGSGGGAGGAGGAAGGNGGAGLVKLFAM
jgi:hypothetical protein